MASKELSTTATNASNQIALINEYLTGPPAEELVRRSGIYEHKDRTNSDPLRILDNASGIGTLIFRALIPNLKHDQIEKVTAGDLDENYLSFLRERAETASLSTKIEALKMNQQKPGLESSSFDYIFNNFGVFFAPNDEAVLQETLRMLKPGGIAGFSSWNKISWWDEILLPAMKKYLPGAPALPDPANLFPAKGWMEIESVQTKLEGAGFGDVDVEVWSFTPDVNGEDFAHACAHLVKAVVGRAWKEEERKKFGVEQIERAMRDYLHSEFEAGKWTGKMSAVLALGSKT
ncbi:hypothetical protein CKM354_000801700 [Cercospora kikuchii]|uniref:Methyltransferase type 11 domain-containing protein n=1 Tax=Cercospora kikuchii TaxID=84275 RepID=A0A9P3CLC8_9PEZI|nr:uncharacterized protein CKM354_000801700 [Cercospora kikuchii]GIZ44831.1 hypothetical protein CKM354_000801700 [Cercospora kikuchii]